MQQILMLQPDSRLSSDIVLKVKGCSHIEIIHKFSEAQARFDRFQRGVDGLI